ncbi:MAG: ketoacyl-ACP synthase III [Bacteroidales bacterium]|nr:ketoacyl-ACP synthase III [Bacteroidales bacterium]
MKIIGTGSSHPERKVTNHDLAQFLDTSDEWIATRTGIRERRILTKDNITDLAVEAAIDALNNSQKEPGQIDYIICSNIINDYLTPGLSAIIQSKIGTHCPCLDINTACTGFVYALQLAESLQVAGMAKNILIICAEEVSKMVDWTDRASCILFGDAAAAAVVAPGDNLIKIKTDCIDCGDVIISGSRHEKTPFDTEGNDKYFPLAMNGREVYKHAVTIATYKIESILKECGMAHSDITYYLLHQANLRISEAIRTHIGEDESKFPSNIESFGNMSSAGIPCLLDDLNKGGKLKEGDRLLLCAFGAGFTTGTCIIDW